MPQEQSQIRERQRTDLREPPRYKVTIHNDDFTPMDFVVKVLTQVWACGVASTLVAEKVVCLALVKVDLTKVDNKVVSKVVSKMDRRVTK